MATRSEDMTTFAAALAEPDPPAAIVADVEAVTQLGGTGTPTILINGYQWFGLPTRVQLDSILEVSRAGTELSE